ncbi:MAG: endonuclease III domain-containing protein, partial [Hyphomicrobium sp.]
TVPQEELERDIFATGFYRQKAKSLRGTMRVLLEEFDGVVPRTLDELVRLPGVGRKTANVILNVAFGEPTLAVDTHVFRVANRTGLSDGKTPLAVEEDLLRVIPPKYGLHAHHWLILHGRYVCKARRPECPSCLIRDLCLYDAKTPGIGV